MLYEYVHNISIHKMYFIFTQNNIHTLRTYIVLPLDFFFTNSIVHVLYAPIIKKPTVPLILLNIVILMRFGKYRDQDNNKGDAKWVA